MTKKCICKQEVLSFLDRESSKVGGIYNYGEERIGDILGTRRTYYYVYNGDVFLFMLNEKDFKNNFQDLEEHREKQLDEILK